MAKKGKASKPAAEPTPPSSSSSKGKNKKDTTPEPTKSKKKKDASTPEPTSSTPAKPQRGLAIGDNFGWTGKLPVTLLNEHCQKQKWGKCQYDMMKRGNGFVGLVTLNWENPKTKEMISIKLKGNYEPKETTNEARHMVATFVLHRINYNKNMKMLLPVIFRDYWTQLEEERVKLLKEDKAFHDRLFNVNPFLVHLQQRELEEKKEKERLIKQQNEMKVKKPTISLGTSSAANGNKPVSKRSVILDSEVRKFPKKVWENAPFVDIPSDVRTSIEHSIKNHIDWVNTDHDLLKDSNDTTILNNLLSLGFRETHIKESFNYCSKFSDCLEWLLFHIPEDDLPPVFSKRDNDSKMQLKISSNLEFEYALKRMLQSGIDEDEVLEVYRANSNDEQKTCVELTKQLGPKLEVVDEPESQEIWDQEIEGLEVTGVPIKHEKNTATVKLDHESLEVRVLKSDNYPNEFPGIQIIVSRSGYSLANYIKLSIVRQLLEYLQSYVGECMIYTIIEWLNENVTNIINNPGPLVTEKATKKKAITASSEIRSKRSTDKVTFITAKHVENVKQSYNSRISSAEFQDMISERQKLPAFAKKEALVSAINSNQVTLITGETGSGKSTQVVQFIMDELYAKGDFKTKIICTQPRRLSAVSLADRISKERTDKMGQETGYIIRGENKTSKNTRITFVTTGVLLRMLQSSKTNGILENIGYILIDEVHERSVDADFLLILLKKMMKGFPKLKIVLLSATISLETFVNFFAKPLTPLHIEGRTFPIEDYYLDTILCSLNYKIQNSDGEYVTPLADSHFFKSGNINYELIAKLASFIDRKLTKESNGGSILVFLPGVLEISQTIKQINKENLDFVTLPLHSGLTSSEQKLIFRTPPKGKRKIVVSTNVAETSITIPDCVAVIDTGRSKNLFFDTKLNTTKLIENWCSHAEVRQRRGRSGRVTSGVCYHLYTKDTFESMAPQPIPEIKRTRLENLYLIVKSMGISNVDEFLSSGLDAPDKSALSKANQTLHEIGALQDNKLTKLGNYISYLPTDPQSAKLLIMGCIFGCLDVCLTLSAISSTGSPFINSFEQRDKLKQIQNGFSNGQGDFISMANAYDAYMNDKSKRFLNENFLSYSTLKDITSTRSQYLSLLTELGFVPRKYQESAASKKSTNWALVRAIVAGSFYPQIARVQYPDPKYFKSSSGSIEIDPDARQIKFWTKSTEQKEDSLPASRVFIHPSSVLFNDKNSDFTVLDDEVLAKISNDDGTIDVEKARQLIDFKTPQLPKSSSASPALSKDSFISFRSSHLTTKLYIRDITPTNPLSILLFGGDFSYDLSGVNSGQLSHGIVIDNWLPIRTWCKNGVLIKQLRRILDSLIDAKLSNPGESTDSDSDVLEVIHKIINL
ncbi:hypothetical protein Cantr_00371 [Candida viswanathii]|uniref:Uncharacterized protein n=1 Tax=Candida viswanathii TaxID=5486 RepID=A0A367YFF9_9ASCO|nr:hypothetical protein Cantr_00371 [Candida viswanathii]